MQEKIKKAIADSNNRVGNLPFIQTVVDYIEKGTGLPAKANWDEIAVIIIFMENFGESFLDFWFLTPKRITYFFNRLESYPHLLGKAYEYYIKEGGSTEEFLRLIIKTQDRVSFIFKKGFKYEAAFTEDDLTPFGKLFKTFSPEDVRIFFAEARKFEQQSVFYDRIIRNLNFFHQYFPAMILAHFDQIVKYQKNDSYRMIKGFFKTLSVHRLLELDAKTYAPLIEKKLSKKSPEFELANWDYLVLSELYKFHPTPENKERFSNFVNNFLDSFTVLEKYPIGDDLEDKADRIKRYPINYKDVPCINNNYTVSNYYWGDSVIKHAFLGLKSLSESDFKRRLDDFCENAVYMPQDILDVIDEADDGDKMKLLAGVVKAKNKDNRSNDFAIKIMESIAHEEWSPYAKDIWNYLCKQEFRYQVVVAKALVLKPDVVMPLAQNGFSKNKGERLLSFLVLNGVGTNEANELLWKQFHLESGEYIRQNILPIIVRRFYQEEKSLDEVNKIIASAEKRGAIKAGLKGNVLDFNSLPDLFFKDGKELTKLQVQFLLYRMSQIKIMISDPEAKLLMNHIDKSQSTVFAKAILETFLDKGAVAKQKYIMCLAGILGDGSLLDYLKKLFKELHDGKRLKMAQYVIATIAMIGTDAALRHVEFISRKYKRKASLEAAAIEALENAAEELGMDIFELSDKIIPDFGFDGLYKTIDADGEEIRVFVGNDFKLQFITEDNKVRKSVPKAVSKEVKAELKIIQKEIRDVNKAQKERLEQYMVLERRWNREDWEKFYLMNPVMFIYASTLVWGVFDEDNQLKQLFYVDEDASLMDIEDDEINLMDGKIGIIHPLRMTEKQLSDWSKKFYDLDIAQPFAQLNRPTFYLEESEIGVDSLRRYNSKGSAKGGRATQGHFERRGWRKEVSDGGCFDMSKTFKQEGIYVFLSVEGMCIGYYEESVAFRGISFRKVGSSSWDENKIALQDVPAIVFSEVIADMDGIAKKEES